MIPNYYEFQNSAKLLSGERALEHIPYELEIRGCKRPMLLSDRVLERFGTVQTVVDAFHESGLAFAAAFLDIPADSAIAVVNEAASVFRREQCDCLVAVGGGSVLDTAKGVSMVVSHQVEDLMAFAGCESMDRGNHVPFVAIPTTAGTGSEATLVAVIKNPEEKVKMEFISHFLLPDVAVLDPRMTATLPPRTTASTGMDALCHAVEAYTCMQRNPVSDSYAISAIELIRDHLETAVTNGRDLKARLAMANAAYLAGAAFSNSMVGMVHAIGHALGGVCHVPHGDAMTILLPHCMEYNFDLLGERYGQLYYHLAGPEAFLAAAKEDRGRLTIAKIKEMSAKFHDLCGLSVTLSQAGVKKEDFEAVARTALNDGAMIVNPKQVDLKDVLRVLDAAY
ncbi:iron-containing alcohol dehydrogenase [Angelakisella massiliensis]|uniref:iron-containing alcohol dehydrogenase n=1 Tax=Angelakisella massiliensis TaxID=1871018 RepID=UPI0023A864F7|nr:iron-containing alcohol dehydrogenase [Angelakisella massiliensis]